MIITPLAECKQRPGDRAVNVSWRISVFVKRGQVCWVCHCAIKALSEEGVREGLEIFVGDMGFWLSGRANRGPLSRRSAAIRGAPVISWMMVLCEIRQSIDSSDQHPVWGLRARNSDQQAYDSTTPR